MLEYTGEPMNGVDTAWLRMDRPTNLMVITAMVVTERIEFCDFRELLRQRFLAFSRFRKKPVQRSGLYFWELDEDFDLDAHVRRAALPGKAGKEELQAFVSDLISTPLDPDKPLWQFQFIENYGDRCAIIIRVHHCYADGLSLVAIFGALTESHPLQIQPSMVADEPAANDETSQDREHQSWQAYQKVMDSALKSVEKYSRKVSEESLHLLHEPSSMKSAGRLLLNVLGEISRLAALPSDPKTKLTGALGTDKLCVWSEPMELERFKGAGRSIGCSVNDVLLSCVTGTLRRYMSQFEPIDEDFEVHASVPVNIRFPEENEASFSAKEIGNRFGTVFMALPVGVAHPVERIYRIKHEMRALRRSLQSGVSYGLMAALGLMPGKIQRQVLDLFSRKSSLVLSNVPGVQQPRYLASSKVHEAIYWVPQTGDIAIGVSLLSYNGKVQVGLVVDKRIVNDPQVLMDAFTEELSDHERFLAFKTGGVSQAGASSTTGRGCASTP